MANYKIDKSVLEEAEREQLEALLAKAAVNPEAAKDEMEDEEPAPETTKKSAVPEAPEVPEVPEFIKDAVTKSNAFIERIEKNEMAEIAKKYSLINENTAELAEQLYNLKKSDPTMYETCISMLDNQVSVIEKSGLFQVIGKSATGNGATGAEGKAEAKAQELMKSNPNMSYATAIAKAWEDPALMAEYDAEYSK